MHHFVRFTWDEKVTVKMTLTLDRTLWRLLKRTTFSFGRISIGDGAKRHFWREKEVEKKPEDDKKTALQERQRELLARGLPKKRPIPGD